LIYLCVSIPIALRVVSFVSIWLMRDAFTLAMNLLKIAVGDSAMEYTFATVPLFSFIGLIVSKAGMGSDIYDVVSSGFRRVTGGIEMATVGANAAFAAVTGSSIASASVFSKVAVAQMINNGFNPRFAVRVVALCCCDAGCADHPDSLSGAQPCHSELEESPCGQSRRTPSPRFSPGISAPLPTPAPVRFSPL
jgi:TRAP-type mannitol/chloroaromatic compound transport system permease large subunit